MNKLFFAFIILLCAIGLGFLIHQDPGFAMVSYQHWVIATSIWVAFACVVLSFFILYFLVRLVKNIFAVPRMLARRRLFLNAEKHRKYTAKAVIAIAVGDFKKAEKYSLKAGTQYDTSYVNYLIAAQAAQAQKAFSRRDAYLEKALRCGKDETFAISLTQAQFMLQSGQCDEALLILKHLQKQEPKNALVVSGLKLASEPRA